MNPLLIFLIVLLVLLIVLIFLGMAFRNPLFYMIILGVVVFIAAILLYMYVMSFIKGAYAGSVSSIAGKEEMVIMDNIWFFLLMVFVLIVVALITKSVKDSRIRWNLLFATIGSLLILSVYTVIYYIVFHYEKINTIMLAMTIIMAVLTVLLLLIVRLSFSFLINQFYVLYGIMSFIYMVCILIYIYYIIEKSYDYFSSKS